MKHPTVYTQSKKPLLHTVHTLHSYITNCTLSPKVHIIFIYIFILHTHIVTLPHYMLYEILHSITTHCTHYYSLYFTHIYTPILDSVHVVGLLQYPLYRQ